MRGLHSQPVLAPLEVPTIERGKPPKSERKHGQAKPKRTILIVDDSIDERTVIAMAIKSILGFRVHQATNGVEAIIKAQEIKPDLIVMDLSLPFMTGLEASKMLRLDMSHVPIVALTTYADEIKGPRSQSFGFLAVFSKADGLTPLLNCLRELFP